MNHTLAMLNVNALAHRMGPIRRVIVALLTATTCSVIATTQAQAQDVTLSPGFSPNPTQVQGAGGGETAINQILGQGDSPNGPCTGFTNQQPNHTLELTAFFNSLSVAVQSGEDTALAIQGPGGVWCNDDFDGKNPQITGQWLPGTYKIWVSSYAKGRSPAYTLRITQGQ